MASHPEDTAKPERRQRRLLAHLLHNSEREQSIAMMLLANITLTYRGTRLEQPKALLLNKHSCFVQVHLADARELCTGESTFRTNIGLGLT